MCGARDDSAGKSVHCAMERSTVELPLRCEPEFFCRHIDVGLDRLVILLFKTALKLRADVPCRYGSKKADV